MGVTEVQGYGGSVWLASRSAGYFASSYPMIAFIMHVQPTQGLPVARPLGVSALKNLPMPFYTKGVAERCQAGRPARRGGSCKGFVECRVCERAE